MKKSMLIFRSESSCLLHRSKILLLVFLIVIFYESILSPVKALSAETGLTLHSGEPFVLLCTRHANIILIPIMYIVLLSEFPCCSTQYFQMIRTGKKQWFFGEMFFVLTSSLLIVLIIFASSMLCMGKQLTQGSEWSMYMTQMRELFPEKYNSNTQLFLDASTIAHGKTSGVLLYTVLMMWLYLAIIGTLLIFGTMIAKKTAAMISACSLTVVGGTAIYFGDQLKWLFPPAHLEFGLHFDSIFSKVDFSLEGSLVYISAILIALVILCLSSLKRLRIGEEQ